ncbi:MAG: rhomboid family protein [Deltaproteobacteria bacterium]|nr:rhomboid family protein [Deltaproteobacteria bacterium]
MTGLTQQRCFNHSEREAVALCPECGSYYCRECVVEHDDRLLCSSCLDKLFTPKKKKGFRFGIFASTGQFLLGFILLWFLFYSVSLVLLSTPSSFHEGTIWEKWEAGE